MTKELQLKNFAMCIDSVCSGTSAHLGMECNDIIPNAIDDDARGHFHVDASERDYLKFRSCVFHANGRSNPFDAFTAPGFIVFPSFFWRLTECVDSGIISGSPCLSLNRHGKRELRVSYSRND